MSEEQSMRRLTGADPRDGLPELPSPLCRGAGWAPLYTANQMTAYAEQCIAHARPEAADGPSYTGRDMSAIFRAGMNTYAMGGRLGGEGAEPVCFRWHSPGHTSQWYGIEDNREWYEMARNSGDAMEFAYLATLTPDPTP